MITTNAYDNDPRLILSGLEDASSNSSQNESIIKCTNGHDNDDDVNSDVLNLIPSLVMVDEDEDENENTSTTTSTNGSLSSPKNDAVVPFNEWVVGDDLRSSVSSYPLVSSVESLSSSLSSLSLHPSVVFAASSIDPMLSCSGTVDTENSIINPSPSNRQQHGFDSFLAVGKNLLTLSIMEHHHNQQQRPDDDVNSNKEVAPPRNNISDNNFNDDYDDDDDDSNSAWWTELTEEDWYRLEEVAPSICDALMKGRGSRFDFVNEKLKIVEEMVMKDAIMNDVTIDVNDANNSLFPLVPPRPPITTNATATTTSNSINDSQDPNLFAEQPCLSSLPPPAPPSAMPVEFTCPICADVIVGAVLLDCGCCASTFCLRCVVEEEEKGGCGGYGHDNNYSGYCDGATFSSPYFSSSNSSRANSDDTTRSRGDANEKRCPSCFGKYSRILPCPVLDAAILGNVNGLQIKEEGGMKGEERSGKNVNDNKTNIRRFQNLYYNRLISWGDEVQRRAEIVRRRDECTRNVLVGSLVREEVRVLRRSLHHLNSNKINHTSKEGWNNKEEESCKVSSMSSLSKISSKPPSSSSSESSVKAWGRILCSALVGTAAIVGMHFLKGQGKLSRSKEERR